MLFRCPACSPNLWAVLPLSWNVGWDSIELTLISSQEGQTLGQTWECEGSTLTRLFNLSTNHILEKSQISSPSMASWLPFLRFSTAAVFGNSWAWGSDAAAKGNSISCTLPHNQAEQAAGPEHLPLAVGNKCRKPCGHLWTWLEFRCWPGCRDKDSNALCGEWTFLSFWGKIWPLVWKLLKKCAWLFRGRSH